MFSHISSLRRFATAHYSSSKNDSVAHFSGPLDFLPKQRLGRNGAHDLQMWFRTHSETIAFYNKCKYATMPGASLVILVAAIKSETPNPRAGKAVFQLKL